MQRLLVCLLLLSLAACQSNDSRDPALKDKPFDLSKLAKSDIDMVADVQMRQSMQYLRELALKLYKRNPAHWRGRGFDGAQAATDWLFAPGRPASLDELRQQRAVAAIRLAFEADFAGDRVLAFVEGLRSMLLDAYEGKQLFYLTDRLDPQKIYNAARNIEVAVWMLEHRQDASGRLFLVSNETEGELKNLSFERLFGKLIAVQDSMAQVLADTTNRRIKNVIQGVAQMVFLPI